MIIDIHSHRNYPYPEGIICADAGRLEPMPGQYYSVGLHPWHSPHDEAAYKSLLSSAADSAVLAVGESGIDKLCGTPLYSQMLDFRRSFEVSEQCRKPLVIHCVRAHDIIISLKREFKPTMPWIIHGFRGKPTVARILIDQDIRLSFGELFNPLALKATPADMIFCETDESQLGIKEILLRLSEAKGEDLKQRIEENILRDFPIP